jgi:hypothetical protein
MRVLSLEAHQSLYEIWSRKSRFRNWTTEMNPIQKRQNYRGRGKLCLRMKNHANGMANVSFSLLPFLIYFF